MQKIDPHISELLYRHDCVIVPDFGGFVANYIPAKIHPTQHIFTPPSKKIVFNINLSNNDGLLANCIAEKEKTTYPEANKIISRYVNSCNTELKAGKKVNIAKVGSLFLDVERNIQFEPDKTINYLVDSFGFTSFQSSAIKRDGHIHRIEKKFKDRPPVPALRKKTAIKRYAAIAIAASLVFAAIGVILKTDLLKNSDYFVFNPFTKTETASYTLRSKSVVAWNETETITVPELTNDTASVTNIAFVDNAKQTITVKLRENTTANHITTADKTNVVPANVEHGLKQKFHIVAGCFKIFENASRFVQKLKVHNPNAAIIGKTKAGLNIVSVGDFNNLQDAEHQLALARSVNPDVWLLKE